MDNIRRNCRMHFSSMKEYVEYFKLNNYIQDRLSNDMGYGKLFENIVKERIGYAGCRLQSTGPEYDLIKGADLKMLYDDASILVDVKLGQEHGMRSNLFYIGDALELSRKKEAIFFYPLTYGLEVGFALRNIRRGKDGYCVLKKPVVVAMFKKTAIAEDIAPHKLFTVKAAKQFARYIELINLTLIREGYPERDSNSFTFVPYNK